MKIFLISLFCFIHVAESLGQTNPSRYGKIDVEITKEKRPKRIYAKVEIKSPFIGGDSSWVQTIEKSINQSLSYKNRAKRGKYIVSVAFVVAEDGILSDIRLVSEPVGFGMDAVVLRVLKKSPKWLPAAYPGSPVRPYRTSSTTPQEEGN